MSDESAKKKRRGVPDLVHRLALLGQRYSTERDDIERALRAMSERASSEAERAVVHALRAAWTAAQFAAVHERDVDTIARSLAAQSGDIELRFNLDLDN